MFHLARHPSETLYATHGLQSYAAKCSPPLVRYGLHDYAKPNELVLDPMVGSDATLVEASLRGRHAIGFDIAPLARLIAQVKAHPLHDESIAYAAEKIITRTQRDVFALKTKRHTAALDECATPPEFMNRDHWFHPHVATQVLAEMGNAISKLP